MLLGRFDLPHGVQILFVSSLPGFYYDALKSGSVVSMSTRPRRNGVPAKPRETKKDAAP